MQTPFEAIALTQYAHGAGCGCKIAPQVLSDILRTEQSFPADAKLLVGNGSNDDAAVYDLGNGTALIATTDFFTPVVDDAYDFGRIAAANAISDVYAMGGKPILALAILGWPVSKLPPVLAQQVLEGARSVCAEAGISLAGGHSIDTPEPVFGLSVNGFVQTGNLKKNNTAQEGDYLFLTKPLGTGILSTAQKRGLLDPGDKAILVAQLTRLNSIGEALGKLAAVSAMTDITGFGLLGHLLEMAEGSGLTAVLKYSEIPLIPSVPAYIRQMAIPDATYRNWNAYESRVHISEGVDAMQAFTVLPDPQTNGGLLFAVNEKGIDEVVKLLGANGLEAFCKPVGRLVKAAEKPVLIEP